MNRCFLFACLSAAMFALGCDDDDNDIPPSEDATVQQDSTTNQRDSATTDSSTSDGSAKEDSSTSDGSAKEDSSTNEDSGPATDGATTDDATTDGGTTDDGSIGTAAPFGSACQYAESCSQEKQQPAEYEACVKRGGCDRDHLSDDEYTACLNRACDTKICQTTLFANYGFCSRQCIKDIQCEGAVDGPYGQNMTCVSNGSEGYCLPGHPKERCDANDGRCSNEGEVCKPSLLLNSSNYYGGSCQPKTEGGLPTGAFCDEVTTFCANDFCFEGICSNYCDPDSSTPNCDPTRQECMRIPFSSSLTFNMCMPKRCKANKDCGEGMFCDIGVDYERHVLTGICTILEEGQEPEACLTDKCAKLCENDTDCTDGSACTILNITSGGTESFPIGMCLGAAGSHRPCSNNDDCAADDTHPKEACDYLVRSYNPLSVDAVCVTIPENAVQPGKTCRSSYKPCQTDSLCLISEEGADSGTCSAVCEKSSDCPEKMYCAGIYITSTTGAGLCVKGQGSMADCNLDASCADGEFCDYNTLVPNPAKPDDVWELEKICKKGNADGKSGGQDCTQNADCRSNRCIPWSNASTTSNVKAYCYGSCSKDEDCSSDGSITCEEILYSDPSENTSGDELYAKFCVPKHVCAVCSGDNKGIVCGGGLTCAEVTFDADVKAMACLESCGDGDSCAEGFTCTTVDEKKLCMPDQPNTTCIDAKPKASSAN